MTTLEIVSYLAACGGEQPCAEGVMFATEHPDPFEALEAAVGSDDSYVRQFVRWVCWQPAVMGYAAYNRLSTSFLEHAEDTYPDSDASRRLTERCAKELREWLHGFLAEHEIMKGEQA